MMSYSVNESSIPINPMLEDKNDLHKRLEEIARQSQDRELTKNYNLSQKNMAIAVILSLLFPFVGYIYTARWRALSILFGVIVGIIAIGINNTNDEREIDKLTTFCGVLAAIVAPIDNAISIQIARDKINNIK